MTPQCEDGYTKIANELFEAILRFPFTKRQLLVLLSLIRKTYGFGKKTDDVTVTQLSNLTSLARQNVSKTITALVSIGAVSKRDGTHGYVLGISKNYGEWRAASNQDTPASNQDMSQIDAGGVSKRCTQKITPKERKYIPPKRGQRPDYTEPFEVFWKAYPRKEDKAVAWRKFEEHKCADHIDTLLADLEKRKRSSWKGREKKHIPLAATYINQGRYWDILENEDASVDEFIEKGLAASRGLL